MRGLFADAVAERDAIIERLGLAEALAANPAMWVADPDYRKAQTKIERVMREVLSHNEAVMIRGIRPWVQGFGRESREELATIAMTAMFESFVSWEPGAGSKFSTWYLTYGLKEALAHHVGGSKGWPSTLVDRKTRIDRAERDLTESLGRQPTASEIVDDLGWSETSTALVDVMRRKTRSLDAPIRGTTGSAEAFEADVLADDTSIDFTALADTGKLDQLLSSPILSPLEVFITIRRSGIDGFGSQNLVKLANDTGIGRESLRRAAVKLDKKLESLATAA